MSFLFILLSSHDAKAECGHVNQNKSTF